MHPSWLAAALAAFLLAAPAFAGDPSGLPDAADVKAQPAPATPEGKLVGKAGEPRNVILLMFDGVRWQDFLDNKPDPLLAHGDKKPTFPEFWKALAPQGVVYEHMTVSNGVALSMPAYQSIFAGATQPCKDNDCARVGVETFPERLVREGVPRAQVATFAAWERIPYAVEHVDGATFTDAGDAGKTRLDVDTFPKALAYIKANKPRFEFISLNDADQWGHAGSYPEYLSALRRYDGWMTDLLAVLQGMGDYGKNTTVLVTTDHGRGVLWDWKHHGHRPWARRVWLYAYAPGMSQAGTTVKGGEHADIRSTIETLLGLAPAAVSGGGQPLAEIVAP